MGCSVNKELIEKTIAFHGHSCPGLVIGIRAAELALEKLGNAEKKETAEYNDQDRPPSGQGY